MKAAGADIVVILSHSGIADTPRQGGEENFSYYLAQIPDITAIITGHAHDKFPGAKTFSAMAGVDNAKGTINGIPTIMPSAFADTLGVLKLTLTKTNGVWQRTDGSGSLVPVYDNAAKKSNFAADSDAVKLMADTHQAVVNYINSPVGAGNGQAGAQLTAPMTSYFSLIRDDYSVQIINDAQLRYGKLALANSDYASLPMLSAAAPFKAGGRNGPNYYTNVPAGPLVSKNIADIYVYPNTVMMVKLTGADIKEWLEMSAGQFNQLNTGSDEQFIVNNAFPTYNFDVIDGVTYKIDITQPAKYNADGTIANAQAERIKDLSFNGQPISPTQDFVVVTNNYRASGGGNFPGVNSSKIIFRSPDESRQAILQYIADKQTITPQPDNNWSLILPQGSGPLLYLSSPAAQNSLPQGISFVRMDNSGFAVYQIQP